MRRAASDGDIDTGNLAASVAYACPGRPRLRPGQGTSLSYRADVATPWGAVGAFFSVYFQHVAPGAFVTEMALITGLTDVVDALVGATLSGLTVGLIGCYMRTPVGGGPAGIGNAVNKTVMSCWHYAEAAPS
jgi:hypothetical protein